MRTKLLMVLVFLIVRLAFFAGLSCAQTDEGASCKIVGILVDKESKEPVEGIWLHLIKYEGVDSEGKSKLALFILDNGKFPRTQSDSSGRFSFSNLPPGRYVIKTGTSTGFIATDSGRTSLQDSTGNVIVIKLKAGQTMDLGKVSIEKEN